MGDGRHAVRVSVDAKLVDKRGECQAEGRLQAAQGQRALCRTESSAVECFKMQSNMDTSIGKSIAAILKSMQCPDAAYNNESRIESTL